MWPLKLDMTRDESRGMLRRLELDTYSSVMSTFRAQGALCKEKARILEELRKLLHISQDRHKAEARRVANDERLTTVAEIISGPNSTQDWSREGRRTFPILPRTAPYTALSYIANTVCEQITRENSKLPHPFETSQNRLQKEQQQEEERKQKLLLEQAKLAQAAVPIEIKEEADEPMVAALPAAAPEPVPNVVHPPVVTADPFVEAANKSYINNDLKRSYPIEPLPALSSPVPIDDDSPLRKKPQLYQELQRQEPPMPPQSPIVTFHQQFPTQQQQQQIPAVAAGPMSPHNNLTSPNNFGMAPMVPMPQNMSNNNFNNPKPAQGRNSNKNTERPRKSSVSKKNQNKTKTPYQTNKQAGGKANKNSIAQAQMQQQQQMMPGGPIVAPGKSQKGNNNNSNSANSPHLIHSYASPLIPYEIPQQHQPQLVGATAEVPHEPLQLQKHLTSNAVYQPNQQYGMTPIKSAPYTGPYQQPMASMPAPNPVYGQQHQILPSSKKDIQYNLTKLNPTNSSKNNVNIPLKQSGGSSSLMQGKGHPLFNYQKKSPSKNVLIPTSSAAAALASFGIPKNIQPRKDVPKFREPDPSVNPADIPNPKIIFSTSHHQEPQAIAPKSSGSQITILDQITLHPPHTIVPSTSVGTGLTITPSQTIGPVTHITPAAVPSSPGTSPLAPGGKMITPPIGTIPANKLVTIKGPNLAGFTPVKSGSKLSVHKLQLMPIGGQPGGNKNNVIVLPAKGGTLNPGQKITIPRSSVTSVVDPATIISPPKVIVQQQPDLNNIVLLDLASEQNKLKTTTQPKSVITDDTPVDIVSTPLDVVTGAVKLQELKGFLSPASSSGTSTTASPLTEKMVKPQQPNSSASKATKFEADSTAPGPSAVPVPKKTKANHQPRGSTSVAALSKKTKATTAAASSTTTAGSDPTTARNPAMSSSTDWELELDQANQATNTKHPTQPNPPPKVTQKSSSRSTIPTLPVTNNPSIPKPSTATPSTSKKTAQPLSSSSISSTSSNASSPVVVEQDVQRIAAASAAQQPRVTAPPPPPPVTPVAQKIVLPLTTTTTSSPPNERSSDDTSATDSANAEEDPDPEYPAFREATSESDDDYEHFNAVIEEDPDPEDAEDIHGERVEIVNVGYDTSRALIADLEDTSGGTPTAAAAMIVEEDDRNGGGVGGTINPSSMNFVQYIEEADVGVGELVVDANGGAAVGESTSGANGTRNITFEMVEIDSEGNKHTRTMSYEEALAEGHITTEEADVKGGSSGGSGAAGLVKGKTKMAS
uniref:BRCA2-interacting transcriptional repressor EMSY n=1 Tax=Culex pipiens TaxID=7175 RepID=A0A8D8DNX3_CULPI